MSVTFSSPAGEGVTPLRAALRGPGLARRQGVIQQLCRALVPCLQVRVEGLENDVADALGNLAVLETRGDDQLAPHEPLDVRWRRRVVRKRAGQHLVHSDADGVDVAGEHCLPMELLRRHVGRAADHSRPVSGDFQKAGRPEVGDLEHSGFRHEHIARPKIPVQDAGTVRVIDRVANLARKVEGAIQIERALAHDDVFERFAGDVLHDDEEHVLLLFSREYGDDIGVAHGGEQPRLLDHLAEVEILLVRDLEGDLLVDPRVFGEIDGAEAAAAEGRQDAVLPDGLTAEKHLRWREYSSPQARTYNRSVHTRFHAPAAERTDDVVELPRDEAQHLFRVLRLKVGAAVRVFNGRGDEFDAVVATVSKDGARVRVGPSRDAVPESRVTVTLAQAVLKGDKMDDVVCDAVMMGVAAIQPLVATRSEIWLAALQRGQRQARWQRVAVSSAKQCGRAVVPAVLEPRAFKDVAAWLADTPRSGPGLMFVEPSALGDVRALGDLDGSPPLETAVLIGPEGGWTAQEIDAGSTVCRLVTLGARTLRADAMAIVALTALFTSWREL